jgi:hypothetical protein
MPWHATPKFEHSIVGFIFFSDFSNTFTTTAAADTPRVQLHNQQTVLLKRHCAIALVVEKLLAVECTILNNYIEI